MKIYISFIIISLLFIAGCSKEKQNSAGNFRFVDDLGNPVTLEGTPKKVISLAPNITEMLYRLGCGKELAGCTTFCDYPEEAKKAVKVGDLLSVDFERLLVIKPDLILVTVEGNRKEIYDKLVSLGFNVFVSNPRNYEGIKKTYLDLASIMGKQDIALKETAEWDNKLKELQKLSGDITIKKCLFLIETRPIMAAGKTTFLNEYIRLLNLSNVTEGVSVNYPVLNRESVIKMNPDVIVYPADGVMNLKMFKESYSEWRNLSAIKNNNIIFADRNLYFRPGPRFIEALTDFYSNLRRLTE